MHLVGQRVNVLNGKASRGCHLQTHPHSSLLSLQVSELRVTEIARAPVLVTHRWHSTGDAELSATNTRGCAWVFSS